MGRKLIQLLEVPSLTHELYVFTRKDLCFGTSRKCLLSEFSILMQLISILVEKISPVIFDPDYSFNDKMLFA